MFTNMLQYLAKKGLTAAAIIANFHRQTVIPLMEMRLPIFELTPEAPVEGSRTLNELFSHDAAARRARSAVAHFPSNPEDLREGVHHSGEFGFRLLSILCCSFPCLLLLIQSRV